jgi:hypothetical protein
MARSRRSIADMLMNEFEVEDSDIKKRPLEDTFREEPPTLDQFVQDKQFLQNLPLGEIQYDFVRHFEQILYPETYIQMVEHFDPYWQPVRHVNELTAEWAKGSGKDHCCQICVARVSNILLCLNSPQEYFGMPHQTIIHIMNVAASAPQAHGVFFKPLRTLLTHSPWFKDKFEGGEPGPQAQVIRFKNQVELISGHSSAETLEGKNLLAAIADEISAFPTLDEVRTSRSGRTPAKTADGILDMLRSSSTTRFPKTFKLAQISYPRFKGDAIEQALAVAKQDNAENAENSTYYASGPWRTWEVNPLYKTIERVEVQGATGPVPNIPSIISDYKKNAAFARAKYEARPEFSENRFFANDTAIIEGFGSGVQRPENLGISYHYGVDEGGVASQFQYNVDGKERPGWQVKFDLKNLTPIAGALYALHGDMAITGDRAGVAMSHVRTWERKDWDSYGGGVLENRPVVRVDFATAFEADAGGQPQPREVQIRWYRKLIWELRAKGFMIVRATFDNFQSTDTMQQLVAQGIESKRVSTDTNNVAWETLRDVMYDGRLDADWNELTVHEIQRLTLLNNGRVDHPPGGSKDIADALACSVLGAIELGGDEGEMPQVVDSGIDLFGNKTAGPSMESMMMPDSFSGMGMGSLGVSDIQF